MPRELKVVINEDGSSSHEVIGGAGESCLEMTDGLDKLIGPSERELTGDFYKQERNIEFER